MVKLNGTYVIPDRISDITLTFDQPGSEYVTIENNSIGKAKYKCLDSSSKDTFYYQIAHLEKVDGDQQAPNIIKLRLTLCRHNNYETYKILIQNLNGMTDSRFTVFEKEPPKTPLKWESTSGYFE